MTAKTGRDDNNAAPEHREPSRTIGLQMSEISERKRDLLRRLVEEYVATGEPVGSKTLVERSGLPVSSSTVRNELAEL